MKTILVTGATSGIGEAFALYCAKQGHKVIACGRNETKLAELAAHDNIDTRQFDVTQRDDTVKALKTVTCDIAVLNAGTCEYVDVDAFESDMFRRVFEPNFFGVVNCVEALLPQLQPGNQIALVDSMARLLPFTRSQAYGASKAALHYFGKSLAVDLVDKGIEVQTLSPGFVATPLTDKNDFDMPMIISAEDAAKAMLNALIKGKKTIYFPTFFGLILRFFSLLPDSITTRLALVLKRQALAKGHQL